MNSSFVSKMATFGIASVWGVNGFFCKVLNMVPRHELIVARILGPEFSKPLTTAIGMSEVMMAIWILSGIKSRLNTAAQVLLIASMNTLEFILAPDLLLWGRANALFAVLFIGVILLNQRVFGK
jgi:hypothetical protein